MSADLATRLEQAQTAARVLAARAAGVPDLSGLRIRRIVKIHRASVVAQVRLNGRRAFAKLFTGPDAAATVRGITDELGFMTPHMAPPLGLMGYEGAWPERGLILLSPVPGRPLSEVLATARGPRRTRLLEMSGQWLGAYAAPRREMAGFGAGYWQGRAAAVEPLGAPADVALARAILAAADRIAQDAAGTPITRAFCHGDFSPANLLVSGGPALWGIDIGGPRRRPVLQDAALFLTWLDLGPSGPRPLDPAQHAAFLAGLGLPDDEVRRVLPFFLGLALVARLRDVAGRPHHLPGLRAAGAEFLRRAAA